MSVLATKLQVGAAAVAVATAAAITPAVAHSAPSLAPFSENVGNSAAVLIDPVVILPGSNKKAAADATPPAEVIQVFISGFVDAFQNGVQAAVQFFGTFAYGGFAFTGLVASLVGQVLPGPLGDVFSNLGEGLDAAAWNIAKAIKIGPYSTSS